MSQEDLRMSKHLNEKVFEIRRRGLPEAEEDALVDPILDALDPLWWSMTRAEQKELDAWIKEKRARGEIP